MNNSHIKTPSVKIAIFSNKDLEKDVMVVFYTPSCTPMLGRFAYALENLINSFVGHFSFRSFFSDAPAAEEEIYATLTVCLTNN